MPMVKATSGPPTGSQTAESRVLQTFLTGASAVGAAWGDFHHAAAESARVAQMSPAAGTTAPNPAVAKQFSLAGVVAPWIHMDAAKAIACVTAVANLRPQRLPNVILCWLLNLTDNGTRLGWDPRFVLPAAAPASGRGTSGRSAPATATASVPRGDSDDCLRVRHAAAWGLSRHARENYDVLPALDVMAAVCRIGNGAGLASLSAASHGDAISRFVRTPEQDAIAVTVGRLTQGSLLLVMLRVVASISPCTVDPHRSIAREHGGLHRVPLVSVATAFTASLTTRKGSNEFLSLCLNAHSALCDRIHALVAEVCPDALQTGSDWTGSPSMSDIAFGEAPNDKEAAAATQRLVLYGTLRALIDTCDILRYFAVAEADCALSDRLISDCLHVAAALTSAANAAVPSTETADTPPAAAAAAASPTAPVGGTGAASVEETLGVMESATAACVEIVATLGIVRPKGVAATIVKLTLAARIATPQHSVPPSAAHLEGDAAAAAADDAGRGGDVATASELLDTIVGYNTVSMLYQPPQAAAATGASRDRSGSTIDVNTPLDSSSNALGTSSTAAATTTAPAAKRRIRPTVERTFGAMCAIDRALWTVATHAAGSGSGGSSIFRFASRMLRSGQPGDVAVDSSVALEAGAVARRVVALYGAAAPGCLGRTAFGTYRVLNLCVLCMTSPLSLTTALNSAPPTLSAASAAEQQADAVMQAQRATLGDYVAELAASGQLSALEHHAGRLRCPVVGDMLEHSLAACLNHDDPRLRDAAVHVGVRTLLAFPPVAARLSGLLLQPLVRRRDVKRVAGHYLDAEAHDALSCVLLNAAEHGDQEAVIAVAGTFTQLVEVDTVRAHVLARSPQCVTRLFESPVTRSVASMVTVELIRFIADIPSMPPSALPLQIAVPAADDRAASFTPAVAVPGNTRLIAATTSGIDAKSAFAAATSAAFVTALWASLANPAHDLGLWSTASGALRDGLHAMPIHKRRIAQTAIAHGRSPEVFALFRRIRDRSVEAATPPPSTTDGDATPSAAPAASSSSSAILRHRVEIFSTFAALVFQNRVVEREMLTSSGHTHTHVAGVARRGSPTSKNEQQQQQQQKASRADRFIALLFADLAVDDWIALFEAVTHALFEPLGGAVMTHIAGLIPAILRLLAPAGDAEDVWWTRAPPQAAAYAAQFIELLSRSCRTSRESFWAATTAGVFMPLVALMTIQDPPQDVVRPVASRNTVRALADAAASSSNGSAPPASTAALPVPSSLRKAVLDALDTVMGHTTSIKDVKYLVTWAAEGSNYAGQSTAAGAGAPESITTNNKASRSTEALDALDDDAAAAAGNEADGAAAAASPLDSKARVYAHRQRCRRIHVVTERLLNACQRCEPQAPRTYLLSGASMGPAGLTARILPEAMPPRCGFTLLFWLRVEHATMLCGDVALVRLRGAGAEPSEFDLYLHGATLHVRSSGGYTEDTDVMLSPYSWFHIGVVLDEGGLLRPPCLKIFVDGKQAFSSTRCKVGAFGPGTLVGAAAEPALRHEALVGQLNGLVLLRHAVDSSIVALVHELGCNDNFLLMQKRFVRPRYSPLVDPAITNAVIVAADPRFAERGRLFNLATHVIRSNAAGTGVSGTGANMINAPAASSNRTRPESMTHHSSEGGVTALYSSSHHGPGSGPVLPDGPMVDEMILSDGTTVCESTTPLESACAVGALTSIILPFLAALADVELPTGASIGSDEHDPAGASISNTASTSAEFIAHADAERTERCEAILSVLKLLEQLMSQRSAQDEADACRGFVIVGKLIAQHPTWVGTSIPHVLAGIMHQIASRNRIFASGFRFLFLNPILWPRCSADTLVGALATQKRLCEASASMRTRFADLGCGRVWARRIIGTSEGAHVVRAAIGDVLAAVWHDTFSELDAGQVLDTLTACADECDGIADVDDGDSTNGADDAGDAVQVKPLDPTRARVITEVLQVFAGVLRACPTNAFELLGRHVAAAPLMRLLSAPNGRIRIAALDIMAQLLHRSRRTATLFIASGEDRAAAGSAKFPGVSVDLAAVSQQLMNHPFDWPTYVALRRTLRGVSTVAASDESDVPQAALFATVPTVQHLYFLPVMWTLAAKCAVASSECPDAQCLRTAVLNDTATIAASSTQAAHRIALIPGWHRMLCDVATAIVDAPDATDRVRSDDPSLAAPAPQSSATVSLPPLAPRHHYFARAVAHIVHASMRVANETTEIVHELMAALQHARPSGELASAILTRSVEVVTERSRPSKDQSGSDAVQLTSLEQQNICGLLHAVENELFHRVRTPSSRGRSPPNTEAGAAAPASPKNASELEEWVDVKTYNTLEHLLYSHDDKGHKVWAHHPVAAAVMRLLAQCPRLLKVAAPPAATATSPTTAANPAAAGSAVVTSGMQVSVPRPGGLRRIAVRMARVMLRSGAPSPLMEAAFCGSVLSIEDALSADAAASANRRDPVGAASGMLSAAMSLASGKSPSSSSAQSPSTGSSTAVVASSGAAALGSHQKDHYLPIIAGLFHALSLCTKQPPAAGEGKPSGAKPAAESGDKRTTSAGNRSAQPMGLGMLNTLKHLVNVHHHPIRALLQQRDGTARVRKYNRSYTGKTFLDGIAWLCDSSLNDLTEFATVVMPMADTQALRALAEESENAARAVDQQVHDVAAQQLDEYKGLLHASTSRYAYNRQRSSNYTLRAIDTAARTHSDQQQQEEAAALAAAAAQANDDMLSSSSLQNPAASAARRHVSAAAALVAESDQEMRAVSTTEWQRFLGRTKGTCWDAGRAAAVKFWRFSNVEQFRSVSVKLEANPQGSVYEGLAPKRREDVERARRAEVAAVARRATVSEFVDEDAEGDDPSPARSRAAGGSGAEGASGTLDTASTFDRADSGSKSAGSLSAAAHKDGQPTGPHQHPQQQQPPAPLMTLDEDDDAAPGGATGAFADDELDDNATVVNCELVYLMQCLSAALTISGNLFSIALDATNLSYNQVVAPEALPFLPAPSWRTLSIPVTDIAEVGAKRRFRMERLAIEFKFRDRTSLLLNFHNDKDVNAVVAHLQRRLARRRYVKFLPTNPKEELKRVITGRWTSGEMTNFEYLLHLNFFAGRSANDLTQYPVMPWVVSDFTSDKLDLQDEGSFRDLRLPVGLLGNTERRTQEVDDRYRDLLELEQEPFHFFTHYSCAATVLHFLVRTEPFTAMHLVLQGGRFDHADRMFHSMQASWAGITRNHQDVKELLPEVYCCPEVLVNGNHVRFGQRQDGHIMDDVVLPPWAQGDARRFVQLMREALESEHVSRTLHHWIDLIFGYKQRGRYAETARNLFHPHTYEPQADAEAPQSDQERRQVVDSLDNIGQCPIQLFTKRHPPRKLPELAHPVVDRRLAVRDVSVEWAFGRIAILRFVGNALVVVGANGGALVFEVTSHDVARSTERGPFYSRLLSRSSFSFDVGETDARCPPVTRGVLSFPYDGDALDLDGAVRHAVIRHAPSQVRLGEQPRPRTTGTASVASSPQMRPAEAGGTSSAEQTLTSIADDGAYATGDSMAGPAPSVAGSTRTSPASHATQRELARVAALAGPGTIRRATAVAILASPDAKSIYLAYAGVYNNTVLLRNVRTRTELCLVPHKARVVCVCASRDNTFLVTGSADTTCAVYDIELRRETIRVSLRHCVTDHEDMITALDVSSELDLLASAAHDGALHLHRLHTPVREHVLTVPASAQVTGNGRATVTAAFFTHVMITSNAYVPAVCAATSVDASVFMWSINGQFLRRVALPGPLCDWGLTADARYVMTTTVVGAPVASDDGPHSDRSGAAGSGGRPEGGASVVASSVVTFHYALDFSVALSTSAGSLGSGSGGSNAGGSNPTTPSTQANAAQLLHQHDQHERSAEAASQPCIVTCVGSHPYNTQIMAAATADGRLRLLGVA